MLRGIDPVLSPDLLHVLRSMGHGDEIALVDVNYPALSDARRLVRADGVPVIRLLRAVLSLMPLDEFVEISAWHMQVVGNPEAREPIMEEFAAIMDRHGRPKVRLGSLERFSFYERVRTCFAVVASGEPRLYGNIILKKGIIRPEELPEEWR